MGKQRLHSNSKRCILLFAIRKMKHVRYYSVNRNFVKRYPVVNRYPPRCFYTTASTGEWTMGPRVKPYKPSKEQLQSAVGHTVPDVIASGLRVLFCGINPSLYSAAVGHHFARPGNRFWPALHRSGFTDREFAPSEEQLLLTSGYGITNLVAGATARASDIELSVVSDGADRLRKKICLYQIEILAILGITAYRTGFNQPDAVVGIQANHIHNCTIWALPNPSGLNANYRIEDIVRCYQNLQRSVTKQV